MSVLGGVDTDGGVHIRLSPLLGVGRVDCHLFSYFLLYFIFKLIKILIVGIRAKLMFSCVGLFFLILEKLT